MPDADEDDGINDIDMKFGGNHDREVVMMEAAGDGHVQDGANWVRMEEKAIRFRIIVVAIMMVME